MNINLYFTIIYDRNAFFHPKLKENFFEIVTKIIFMGHLWRH